MTAGNLVASILSGDRSAEDELITRYRAAISLIIGQIAHDPSTTEDLVQDALVLAITKVRNGEVREPDRLSGFLCSLARNIAIAHFRRPGSEEMNGEIYAAGKDAGPLKQLLQKEREAAVRQVLAEMTSVRDREVLTRFYIAEEDKDSICQDLGLSSLHFNRVLYRARERFRELFQKKGGSAHHA